ncbi:MAG: DUF4402 domain-containing protein [Alphaproteobacteria bacterium]
MKIFQFFEKKLAFSISVLALSGTLLLDSSSLRAESSGSANFQVVVNIVSTISTTKLDDMDFGRFSVGNSGGDIVLKPDGTRNVSGEIALAGGAPKPARFQVAGEANMPYSITMPAGSQILSNGSSSLRVNFDPSLISGGTQVRKLSKDGSDSFATGAVITAEKNQSPGNYSGSFNLTVSY